MRCIFEFRSDGYSGYSFGVIGLYIIDGDESVIIFGFGICNEIF